MSGPDRPSNLRLPATLVVLGIVTLAGVFTVFRAEALPPFTPTFTYTFDEVAPDNPDILPADDECPVGAPCKFLWWEEIPDGQPLHHGVGGISGEFASSSIVAFADGAVVPDGAIVGKVGGSIRTGPVGSCATEGVMVPLELTWLDATIDASTSTGSPSDLTSFSHWPVQLNGVRDDFLTAHPGSVLGYRWVNISPDPQGAFNVLFLTQTDGTTRYVVVGGDPTGVPPPPTSTRPR